MKLITCHIENFGVLEQEDLSFEEGCNVFLKENGAGKSTLAAFLRAMFYGLEGDRKKNTLENERKRYRPWQGGAFGGNVVFSVQQKTYLLTRFFGGKESEDVFELRDQATNRISQDYSKNIGEELFGIKREAFLRTIFFGQQDLNTYATDDMHNSLGNLADLNGDGMGYEAAMELLTKKMNSLTPKRVTGSLAKRREEIAYLQAEIEGLPLVEKQLDATRNSILTGEEKSRQLEREMQEIRTMQNELLKQGEYATLVQQVKEEAQTLKEWEALFPLGIPEEADFIQLRELAKRAEHGENAYRFAENHYRTIEEERPEVETKSFARVGAAVGSLFLLGAILLFFLKPIHLGSLIFLVLGIGHYLFAAVSFHREKQTQEMLRNYERERRKREEELRRKKQEFLELEEAFYGGCRRILGFAPAEKHGFRTSFLYEVEKNAMEAKIHRDNWQAKKNALEEKKEQAGIAAMQEEHRVSAEELNQLHLQMEQLWKELQNRLFTDRQALEEEKRKREALKEKEAHCRRLEELQRQEEHAFYLYKKTKEKLEEAKDSFRGKYASPVLKGFQAYFNLWSEQAEDFRLDTDGNLTLQSFGMQREKECLSAGLFDLAAICLRVAFLDVMYPEEKPFLILDDPFTNLDDENLEKALEFKEKLGESYQILYFTCTKGRI